MSLACDGGQVVVVGSPRGKAKDVNFYDDLHLCYIEVSGAHGNMLFEPNHSRLPGAWDIHKAQRWLPARSPPIELTSRTWLRTLFHRKDWAKPMKAYSRRRTNTSAC